MSKQDKQHTTKKLSDQSELDKYKVFYEYDRELKDAKKTVQLRPIK